VPSRKQRRRRQKERRHEYEVVYVDDDGNEVEAPPRVETKGERGGSKLGRVAARGGRGGRESHPPSWKRSGRRALLFLPLFFIVFSLVNKDSPLFTKIYLAVFYAALFIPLTYMMDRMAYRTSLRRSGREPDAKPRPKSR
jgi:hypothetical protein